MKNTEYLQNLQQYLANIGISGSSLRNQGAAGVVDAARKFLGRLDLTPLVTIESSAYPKWLDETTEALLKAMPDGAQHWGAARKAVNILMVQAFLNGELNQRYSLARLKDELETPLDRIAAERLCDAAGKGTLPKWSSILGLLRPVSNKYQAFAASWAKAQNVPRACLDVILWTPEPVKHHSGSSATESA